MKKTKNRFYIYWSVFHITICCSITECRKVRYIFVYRARLSHCVDGALVFLLRFGFSQTNFVSHGFCIVVYPVLFAYGHLQSRTANEGHVSRHICGFFTGLSQLCHSDGIMRAYFAVLQPRSSFKALVTTCHPPEEVKNKRLFSDRYIWFAVWGRYTKTSIS